MNNSEWLRGLGTTLSSCISKVGTASATTEEALSTVQSMLAALRQSDGTLWWVGNGGSAALCLHLSQDTLNKLGVRSMVLSDAPLLTCMANDFGYAEIYVRPLRTLARPGDMLIAVSSSGRSQNILNCVDLAIERGLSVVGLSAFDQDNPLWQRKADVSFYLPTRLYGHAEVGHESLLHAALETMMLREKA